MLNLALSVFTGVLAICFVNACAFPLGFRLNNLGEAVVFVLIGLGALALLNAHDKQVNKRLRRRERRRRNTRNKVR